MSEARDAADQPSLWATTRDLAAEDQVAAAPLTAEPQPPAARVGRGEAARTRGAPMAAVPVDRADALAVAMLREFVDQATEHTTAELVRARAALDQLAAGTGRYLTVADVAELLAVSPDTVRQLIADGRLPAARLGYRTVRVPAAALTDLVSTCRAGAARIGGQLPRNDPSSPRAYRS